jgi:large subunit ribosomal protein L22
MKVKTSLKFARIRAQKTRLIADTVRESDVSDAIKTLTFMNKKTAVLLKKIN